MSIGTAFGVTVSKAVIRNDFPNAFTRLGVRLFCGITKRRQRDNADVLGYAEDFLDLRFAEGSEPNRSQAELLRLQDDKRKGNGGVDGSGELAARHDILGFGGKRGNKHRRFNNEFPVPGCSGDFLPGFKIFYYDKFPFLPITRRRRKPGRFQNQF